MVSVSDLQYGVIDLDGALPHHDTHNHYKLSLLFSYIIDRWIFYYMVKQQNRLIQHFTKNIRLNYFFYTRSVQIEMNLATQFQATGPARLKPQ